MGIFKRLLRGEYSLATTFWGFNVLGNIIFTVIALAVLFIGSYFKVPGILTIIVIMIIILLSFIYSSLIASGIYCMLRRKITFWRVLAFIYIIFGLICVFTFIIGIGYSISYSLYFGK
ncbi:hypothetical protein PT276_00920 [Orbaceae bacterium ESL0721]|nr:hypothetical protein [Orbaceae bacterium ESL0721]